MDSLNFLERADNSKIQPVYALTGEDAFLKRQALAALRALVLGPGEEAFGLSVFQGDKAIWSTIHDELGTRSFFGPRRFLVVENADSFVSRERGRLEKYVAEPSTVGVLVLDVSIWPANTRLAKLIPDAATIVCKAPPAARLTTWCRAWCKEQHKKEISVPAAQLLVDLVGPEMGQLDQELSKLALYAGDAPRIEPADVDALVGNSRSENTWKIFDLIGAGQAREAFTLLERLFDQGEDPLRLLGAFSMQMRRLAQAGRASARGASLSQALEEAGVPPFARRAAEAQLKHLGRRRLDRLYDWLLQTDSGIKGASSLPPRMLLEKLVVRLIAAPKPSVVRSR